jgi:hypothetical protein
VTLDYTNQWHFPSVTDQFPAQNWIRNTFSYQHDKVTYHECNCKQLKTAILQYFLNSSLHAIQWQFINYSAQRFSGCVGNVSHITYWIFSLLISPAYENVFLGWDCKKKSYLNKAIGIVKNVLCILKLKLHKNLRM